MHFIGCCVHFIGCCVHFTSPVCIHLSTGTTFVLPEARRLPAGSVAAEAARCRLLEQHTSLLRRLDELTAAAGEDVTTLARLWQLQTKMDRAGAPYQVIGLIPVWLEDMQHAWKPCAACTCGPYVVSCCRLSILASCTIDTKRLSVDMSAQVRAERVTKACAGLEQRLAKRLELIDGYARVLNMIEIEVELDTQVPDEEMIGIEQQILRLTEVEELQEQWQLQAEAQEEVWGLLCVVNVV